MHRVLRALLPVLALAGGVALAAVFIATKFKAEPVKQDPPGTFVQVQVVELVDRPARVEALGLIEPEKQVVLQPEVTGRVLEQNEALVPGGRIAAGDPIVRIDPRDYSDALKAGQADLAQARLAVREEKTLSEAAKYEWREQPQGFSEETMNYVLRRPHLDAAEARVQSAKSRLAKARRDIARTILRAPFDSIVLTESVDIGQTVSPQSPVVTLAGIDRYRVQISLPVAYLPFVEIPEVNTNADHGSKARIINEAVDSEDVREGYIIRLAGDIDERGRMAKVYVAIDDPLGVQVPPEHRPLPLLIGTSVRIELEGRQLEQVAVIPQRALKSPSSVWVVTEAGVLEDRSVEVVWTEPGLAFVAQGLVGGDRLVTTPLPIATDGMHVTVEEAPHE